MPIHDPVALLRLAADILRLNGLAKGVTLDPDGGVDIYGAVLLAAGANKNLLLQDSVDPADVGVPPIQHAAVAIACDALDALSGDLDTFNDDPKVTADEAIRLVLHAANVLDRR